ncbi:UNVERIFIED_CONTAM: hypothetical protein GTU68_059202 [Idotea baltica]|nr:hypothetical protein [Idotea baltica]
MSYIGIEKNKLNKIAQQLNILLAEYQLYYQNLRNFHWNIKGENFFELHGVFEELYNDAKVKIDDIAERILTLRFRPDSKLSTYLKTASIGEIDGRPTDRNMVAEILEEHKILIARMRLVLEDASDAKDEGTIDLIAGFLGSLEKRSWMLDAWLSEEIRKKSSLAA